MSRTRRSVLALTVAGAMVGLGLAAVPASATPSELADAGGITVRNGAGMSLASVRSDGASGAARAKPGGGGNGISYHSGPVILGTTNIYYIWYGDFSAAQKSVLSNLANSIAPSPYFNINTTYYDGSKSYVTNRATLAGSATDSYSRGKSLNDSDIQQIVAAAIGTGLPKDTNAVYFVLTSADVAETSGFLTKYCGWHTHGAIAGSDIKYSFVGDPAKGMSACAEQTVSPNDPSADAMASVIAHELEEAVTDPDLNAWYDSRGYENADKCAWTFGTTSSLSNGAKYNMTLGGLKYLIQRNWVNASGGYCALSY